ncbi:efflux transporter, RND family, MFP subunit [alpha proteobacterium BAL199]|jgi:RND family efflux transporter MFP subunit|nr:efflux transporter, RND family, MFP subunit [alpha proteobacterium BAL199]
MRQMLPNFRTALLLIGACLLALPATVHAQSAPATAAKERKEVVGVDPVRAEPLSQTIDVLGRLVARQNGMVAARVAERVAIVEVQVGDRVKRGDVLARLADDRLSSERLLRVASVEAARAAVARDRATLAKTRQTLERQDQLKGSTAYRKDRTEDAQRDVEIAQAALTRSQADATAATAQLELADIAVTDATVRAPYDGVVTIKHTTAGAYVRVGDPVVSLLNDSEIEIEADIPADRLAALPPGTTIEAEVQNGGHIFAAVRAIVPEENPRTRTRAVRFVLQVDNKVQNEIAANQSVVLHIPVGGTRDALTVSKDAIVRNGDREAVFVVIDGKAVYKTVALGESLGSRYEVLQGLSAGDVVVIRGNESLRSGQAVQPQS